MSHIFHCRAKFGSKHERSVHSEAILRQVAGRMAVLRLLGGAVVESEAGEGLDLTSRRHPVALLALLAAAPSHTLSRGKLVGLLWPDSPEDRARNRLNTCVHNIRRELGAHVLLSVGGDLRLNPEAISCDVCRFRKAVEDGDLRTAVELYDGPFLDGFRLDGSVPFEHHVDQVQERLRRGYLDALATLAEGAEARGEPEAAVHWWRLRAEGDPYDSRVARRLMEALAAVGNRAAALRHAERHVRRLRAELGTEPGPEVRELASTLERPGAAGAAEGTDDVRATDGTDDVRATDEAGEFREAGGATEKGLPRDSARDVAPPPPASASSADRRAVRHGVEALVVLGLLAAAATAAWHLMGGGGETGPPGDRTVAVLPFRSLGEERPS